MRTRSRNRPRSASTTLRILMVAEELGIEYEELQHRLSLRHNRKRGNAKGRGIPFDLTVDEHYMKLLDNFFGTPVIDRIGVDNTSLCLMRIDETIGYTDSNSIYWYLRDNRSDAGKVSTAMMKTAGTPLFGGAVGDGKHTKNTKWWNNGFTNKRSTTQPDGFTLGRLPISYSDEARAKFVECGRKVGSLKKDRSK